MFTKCRINCGNSIRQHGRSDVGWSLFHCLVLMTAFSEINGVYINKPDCQSWFEGLLVDSASSMPFGVGELEGVRSGDAGGDIGGDGAPLQISFLYVMIHT